MTGLWDHFMGRVLLGLLKGLFVAIAVICPTLCSTSDMSTIMLEWLKALGPLLLGVAVFVAAL
jgi:hypothetical protein